MATHQLPNPEGDEREQIRRQHDRREGYDRRRLERRAGSATREAAGKIRKRRRGSVIGLLGWILAVFVGTALLFLPSDLRAGDSVVMTLCSVLGVIAIALIAVGYVKQRSAADIEITEFKE